MSSRNEPQGRNNGGSNEIGVQHDNLEEEVPYPNLNLSLTVTPNMINYFSFHFYQSETPIGVAMVLANTPTDGVTTYIETTTVEEGQGIGSFQFQEMDHIGNMMKESAQIAYTVARNIMLEKEPENRFFSNSKLCLHHLGGARPINGSGAGCTMITSFLSLAMKKPVRKNLAMTGAVNLTGGILQIAGVREKTIAAKRSKVKMIIFPEANRREFEVLEDHVKEGLDALFVDNYNQVFELAFGYDH